MRDVAEKVARGFGLAFVERDVTEDPEAERRYLFEIPVLFLGDLELARHRVTEEALRERLARAIRLAP
jgi:Glutaredoxin-like domain (DUF836)